MSMSLSGLTMMTSTLELKEFDTLSTKISDDPWIMLKLSSGPRGFGVSSAMKSAKAYALIDGRGLNLLSNSSSSIAHFSNLPETYGLWIICLRG